MRLIADIGGTNARFALSEGGALTGLARLPAAAHRRFSDVLEAYLAGLPDPRRIEGVAIAAAGPVADGAIKVTNLPWVISERQVSARLGGVPVRLLNDLEAVAMALPALGPAGLTPLRAGAAPPGARRIAVNVGTGFGAAVAAPGPGGWQALAGEPGHMALGTVGAGEHADLGHLASVEHLLSGPGLAALHARLGGDPAAGPEAILLPGGAPDGPAARVRRHFARVLGRIAGDLVLATGAWGGCYLCGSLGTHAGGAEFEALFFEAFDAKGAMRPRIAAVPVWRITAPEPALLGLAAMAL